MALRFWKELEKGKTTRSIRRVGIGITLLLCFFYFAIAVVDLFPVHATSRLYGSGSCIQALVAMGYSVFWMWFLRRVTSAMSLDDRAQMDFGKAFAQLNVRQRFDVRVRIRREARKLQPDERDAMLQRDAERRAFWVLKLGLPVVVVAYWLVCLWLPVGPVRVGMLISAVVISGMVIPVMILPDLIRLWTEPDEVREPKVVAMEREA